MLLVQGGRHVDRQIFVYTIKKPRRLKRESKWKKIRTKVT
jgi:hypothetical protein